MRSRLLTNNSITQHNPTPDRLATGQIAAAAESERGEK
jgi:hypothetical protein